MVALVPHQQAVVVLGPCEWPRGLSAQSCLQVLVPVLASLGDIPEVVVVVLVHRVVEEEQRLDLQVTPLLVLLWVLQVSPPLCGSWLDVGQGSPQLRVSSCRGIVGRSASGQT